MNQDRYSQVLEEHMLTILQVQGCEVLMQDEALAMLQRDAGSG